MIAQPGDILDVKSGACFGGARNVLALELERQGVKEEQGVDGGRPVCFPAKHVWWNMDGRDT